ncbi:MAG: PCRF domain-containing protein, partial [Verrucomicrobiota bacterium]
MYIPPETRANLEEVERRSGHLWKFLDVPGKQAQIAAFEEQMAGPSFWDSQKAAQKVIGDCNALKNIVAPQAAFRRQLEDAKTLAELIVESPDGTAEGELEELRKLAADLLVAVAELEISSFLSGPHDRSNAIVTVKAGAGGTESNDWADMLFRMYTRWA